MSGQSFEVIGFVPNFRIFSDEDYVNFKRFKKIFTLKSLEYRFLALFILCCIFLGILRPILTVKCNFLLKIKIMFVPMYVLK